MDQHPFEKGSPGRNLVPARPGSGSVAVRVKWPGGQLHATLGSSWSRTWLRILCLACSAGVLLYSVMVLMHVAWMGTIGVRCMFGTEVEEEVPADFVWKHASGTGRSSSARAGTGRRIIGRRSAIG